MTPVDWSSGVVGVLSSTTSPSGVTQMRSVNVPPTSTPDPVAHRQPPALRRDERPVASSSTASVRSSSEPVSTTP